MSSEDDAPIMADPGARARRFGTSVVIGAIALALLSCCPCGILAVYVARNFTVAMGAGLATWLERSEHVVWSGDGRFAVVQSWQDDSVPIVVAWDREGGAARSVEGYRVAVVERHGAKAWLVPIAEADLAQHTDAAWGSVLVPADGPFDTAAEELLRWMLEDETASPAVVPAGGADWLEWPGPNGWSARAHVDPSRGAYPSTLRVERRHGNADGHDVALPPGLHTFDLVGWAPSGRYLAIAERIDAGMALDPDAADAGAWGRLWRAARPLEQPWDTGELVLQRRLLLIDAERGSVVAHAVQNVESDIAAHPVWHPSADVLIWTDAASDTTGSGEDTPVLTAWVLVPEGSATLLSEAASELGAPISLGDERRVLGNGSEAYVLSTDDDVPTLAPFDADVAPGDLAGPFEVRSTVYHPVGGVLALLTEQAGLDGRSRALLVHSQEPGARGEVVWVGEWRMRAERGTR